MCEDCVTSTITTWVEYVLPTSTMTVWTTEEVIIDYSDTTTITYTLTNSDATPAARRAKRGAIRNAILHDEDSSSIEDKGTSYITTPATSTSTDCFETAVETWVPYGDDQLVMGEDGSPSMSASASASSTSSKASKVYRQDPNASSSGTTSAQATTTPTTTTTTTSSVVSSDPPASTKPSSSTSSGNTAKAPAPAPASSLGGGLYALTYTPYDSSGGCMSAGAVLAQLQDIKSKGFPRIRMYGVDCNQLSTVADQAITLGFSLTLGVYIDHTGTSRGNSDLQTLIAWGKWGAVDIINIGIIP